MTDTLSTEWSLLTRKVISSVLNDKGAAVKAFEHIGDNINLVAPKERPIWQAIRQCFAENQPPLTEAVCLRLNGDTGYARIIAGQFNEIDNMRLADHLQSLTILGTTMLVRSLGQQLVAAKPDELAHLSGMAMNELGNLSAMRTRRNPTAAHLDETLWERLNNSPWKPIPTGITWLDDSIGGLWPTMNFWFVAPYKSFKTTIARNIAIHAARQGYPVTFLAAEGERTMFALDCEMMLASEYMIQNGQDFRDIRLDSLFLLKAKYLEKQDVHLLTRDEYQAIEYGREWYRRLPIYTYDAGDGIRDVSTLRHVIRKNTLEYGSQLVFMDYSQLFGDPAMHLVQRQDLIAQVVQELAVTNELAIALISQQNEETVKAGPASHSPGVKGGGGAAAAADGLFVSKGDPDDSHLFYLQAKLGRRFPAGKKHRHTVSKAGLIVDKWYEVHTTTME